MTLNAGLVAVALCYATLAAAQDNGLLAGYPQWRFYKPAGVEGIPASGPAAFLSRDPDFPSVYYLSNNPAGTVNFTQYGEFTGDETVPYFTYRLAGGIGGNGAVANALVANASTASFDVPSSVAVDAGNFYITDFKNAVIRKITASTGALSTFSTFASTSRLSNLAIDRATVSAGLRRCPPALPPTLPPAPPGPYPHSPLLLSSSVRRAPFTWAT